jgi:hypothetical protein
MADDERNDTEPDELDDDLPESIQELVGLVDSIEDEQRDVAAACSEIKQAIGLGNSTEKAAILKLCDILDASVMPVLSSLALNTAHAAADLFEEIEAGEESMLLEVDAKLISSALLGAAQIMAAYEAETSSEEGKAQCQAVGESITKALTRIKEITVEDDEDQGQELN